jgi:hypothetical protein
LPNPEHVVVSTTNDLPNQAPAVSGVPGYLLERQASAKMAALACSRRRYLSYWMRSATFVGLKAIAERRANAAVLA